MMNSMEVIYNRQKNVTYSQFLSFKQIRRFTRITFFKIKDYELCFKDHEMNKLNENYPSNLLQMNES